MTPYLTLIHVSGEPDHQTDDGEQAIYRCPHCGHEAPLYSFSRVGADDGNVFCDACFEVESMLP